VAPPSQLSAFRQKACNYSRFDGAFSTPIRLVSDGIGDRHPGMTLDAGIGAPRCNPSQVWSMVADPTRTPNAITPGFISIDRFLQGTAPICCFPFGRIGDRRPGMALGAGARSTGYGPFRLSGRLQKSMTPLACIASH
jgi:hypothetical protein